MIFPALPAKTPVQDTVQSVFQRYSNFVQGAKAWKIDVKITLGDQSKFKDGVGTLTLVPHGERPYKLRWDRTVGPFDYHFVTDRTASLEWSDAQGFYDRHLVRNGMPYGRMSDQDLFGFPYPPAVADLRAAFGRATVLKSSGPDGDVITEDIKGNGGERHLIAKVAPDGRLLEFDLKESGMGGKASTHLVFTYQALPAASNFSTHPHSGLTLFQFNEMPDVLSTGKPLPAITLRDGSGPVSLQDQVRAGWRLVAFTEAPLIGSIVQTLNSLQAKAPALVITTGDPTPQIPTWKTDQAGLDLSGVSATPLIYLTWNGRVVQAWVGWDAAKADEFSKAVTKLVAAGPLAFH
jgi:hypothetical protein